MKAGYVNMTRSLVVFLTAITATLGATPQTQEKIVGENIYIVMIVTLIVWLGIFFYLFYLDRKVKTLSERMESKQITG